VPKYYLIQKEFPLEKISYFTGFHFDLKPKWSDDFRNTGGGLGSHLAFLFENENDAVGVATCIEDEFKTPALVVPVLVG